MHIDGGDTAWVLGSAALVLFMTPGLALFYGGMVRSKNDRPPRQPRGRGART